MPNDTETEEIEVAQYECRNCYESFDEGDGYSGDDFCSEHCYDRYYNEDEDEDSIPERKWCKHNHAQFMSKDSGDIIKSPRIFSIEVEAYYPDSYELHRAADRLPREVGISGDGSLGNRGVEFQSPKLQGRNGEALVKTLTSVLNSKDFYVERSCGLHIHLDGKGLLPKTRTKHEPRAVKTLLELYIAYEDVIQSLLPRSRRNNNYARHVRSSFCINDIQNCYTLEALEKLWYKAAKRKELKRLKAEHYNSTRYNGLNLHSLFSDGHLEIRYHSGTINYEKIMHWVTLHTCMVDWATKANGVRGTHELTDLKEKTENLFYIIDLPDATREYYRMRQNLFTGTITTEDNDNNN